MRTPSYAYRLGISSTHASKQLYSSSCSTVGLCGLCFNFSLLYASNYFLYALKCPILIILILYGCYNVKLIYPIICWHSMLFIASVNGMEWWNYKLFFILHLATMMPMKGKYITGLRVSLWLRLISGLGLEVRGSTFPYLTLAIFSYVILR